ncbi:hypothetical protein GCM10017691_04220 [Pseudonocardia petroleophila]|uniref:Uncharacterized protein n=1 Tax=Pseudonocardia petroleophila TaxID=37331 RepID=A0A7G7MKL9_9PSEU|nr:hypothetical protein [Pseudonocardia petroleophila]QNG53330.1 hypothetical protein H6H00_04875 [Pseudonocardia petroleophila]
MSTRTLSQVVPSVNDEGVDEEWIAIHVEWELFTLRLLVAKAASQEVVGPIEGPQWFALDRLEVVDIRASALIAVHAEVWPMSRPFKFCLQALA